MKRRKMKTPKRCITRVALLEAQYRDEDAAQMRADADAATDGTPLFAEPTQPETTPPAEPAPSPNPPTPIVTPLYRAEIRSKGGALRIEIFRPAAIVTLQSVYGAAAVRVTHDEMRRIVSANPIDGAEIFPAHGGRVIALAEDPDCKASSVRVRVRPRDRGSFNNPTERIAVFPRGKFNEMRAYVLEKLDNLERRRAA